MTIPTDLRAPAMVARIDVIAIYRRGYIRALKDVKQQREADERAAYWQALPNISKQEHATISNPFPAQQ